MAERRDIAPGVRTGFRGAAIAGIVASIAMLSGAVAWAHYTEISGAVIAQGSVVVPGKPKSVQHLDGGIVSSIRVADGDAVKEGDVLVTLDDTVLRANLAIYKTRLANALSLKARLQTEQNGAGAIDFGAPPALLDGVDQSEFRKGQQAIFASRQAVQEGRREQLDEKIRQFRNQEEGIKAQIAAKREQLASIDQDLKGMVSLAKKGHLAQSQVSAMQRGRSDILGQIGEHDAELARIANSVRDTELEILLAERQVREEAVTGLREVETQIEELTQQITSTSMQIDRITIRAPVDGYVHEMQVTTVGGVAPPGATILQVIPTDRGFLFETRVEPSSIDQVWPGQPAVLRLSAFNHRTTPDLVGEVAVVSADAVHDANTGVSFYRVMLKAPEEELAKLGDLEIVPGMPVEAFLQTGERSVLAYLAKPVTDQFMHAFRED